MEGDCFEVEKIKIFGVETETTHYSIFFSKKTGTLKDFARACSNIFSEKVSKKAFFGFKLFNKQLYGRMKN